MITRINWRPSNRDLRLFGIILWAGSAIIGLISFLKGHLAFAHWLWSGASLIALIALIYPPGAKPFYWIWMAMGVGIGFITSRILLTLFFFGVITPIALLFKVLKRDALQLKKPHDIQTYWHDHPEIPKDSYRRLF